MEDGFKDNVGDSGEFSRHPALAQFDELLASYAKSCSRSRDSLGMSYAEGALLKLIEKGAPQQQANAVLVALAGVIGDLCVAEFAAMMVPGGFRGSQEDFSRYMDQIKEKAVLASARWLASGPGRPWWFFLAFWRSFEIPPSLERAKETLVRLLEEYFPQKHAEAEATA